MKTTVSGSGVSRLIEKRSDERDNVKLTNAIRKVLNGQLVTFAQITTSAPGFTDIWTDDINVNSVANIEAVLTGYAVASGKYLSVMRRMTAYRLTGIANLVAVDTIGTDQILDGSWGSAFGVSGTAARLRVFGNTDTVNWNARITALWSPYV